MPSDKPTSKLYDKQIIGDGYMRGIDFKNMAAAYLYNVTGDRYWEDEMAATTMAAAQGDDIWRFDDGCQTWAVAAYLHTPRERHYPEIYRNMVDAVNRQADNLHVSKSQARPSRRTANDPRWQTSENLQARHACPQHSRRRRATRRTGAGYVYRC